MSAGFARRPAGAGDVELAHALQEARDRVAELRHDLGSLRTIAARRSGGGLIELDIGRALVALGAADLALKRGHRHVDLEADQ